MLEKCTQTYEIVYCPRHVFYMIVLNYIVHDTADKSLEILTHHFKEIMITTIFLNF